MDERTRERVVVAADALFYGRGIQAVGVDEIRDAAGVGLRQLYREFGGKEGIVIAVLEHRHAIWEAGLFDAASGRSDPRDRLLSMFDFLESWFGEETFRGCGFVNIFGELGATSPSVAAAVQGHKHSVDLYVAALVNQLGADPSLGKYLLLLSEGAQTTAAIEGSADAARHARDAAHILISAAVRSARPTERARHPA